MDKDYWENYYRRHKTPFAPSAFAKYLIEKFDFSNAPRTLELGCGNGRDAICFHAAGADVYAIDQCHEEIDFLNDKYSNAKLQFFADNFITPATNFQTTFDYIYSRFTYHAISEEDEKKSIEWICANLKDNGKFMLEARSTKDTLFGQGKLLAPNTYFYNGHARRFLDYEEIAALIQSHLTILESTLSSGLAICKDEDPVIIRIIAEKTH